MKALWKKFDETELTHSSVHHLMAIHDQLKAQGYARSIDVAKSLNLTRGSVSTTLHKLKAKGYIAEDANKFFRLTEKGSNIVNSVLSVRRTVEIFFRDMLQLPPELAETDACKIEHLLSHPTGEKLMTFVGFALSDAPEAAAFRRSFANFDFLCRAQSDCEVCELDCYFGEKEIPAGER